MITREMIASMNHIKRNCGTIPVSAEVLGSLRDAKLIREFGDTGAYLSPKGERALEKGATA